MVLLLAATSLLTGEVFTQWQSSRVYYGPGNRLVYVADAAGNRIPDFSHAGYRGGGAALPNVPTVKTLSPIAGDNTARIQAAIDSVGQLPIGVDGFRGALLLSAGVYDVFGTIRVNHNGVVLRGVGDGADPAFNTIIKGRGNSPAQRTIIIAGGGSETRWRDSVAGTTTNIVTDSIPVGARWFRVQNPAPYRAGDNIIIFHPCTAEWLLAIDYGGTHSGEPGSDSADVPWSVGSQPIVYNRHITRIAGDTIHIDAPVFNHLVRRLAQSIIYKYARAGIKMGIGIEYLRVDIETGGGTDENHAWDAVRLVQVEDAWVKRCTALHFGQAGFQCATATRVTIDSCNALTPVSLITGERRYNFNMYTAAQLVLVSNSRATEGRHDFVSNGTSYTSGCVFLNCVSEGTYSSSEGHRRWTTGFLFDSITFRNPNTNTVLGLYNRGFYGTSHGWAIAHSVVWNCNAGSRTILVQQPPTAQNYAIGCVGSVTGASPPAPFAHPPGWIEGTNSSGLMPGSLYRAQLAERITVSVEPHEGEQREPQGFHLHQNYPNPFNSSTTIQYSLPDKAHVMIDVYTLLGSRILSLVNGLQERGTHALKLDFPSASSGVYFYRFSAVAANGSIFSATKKLVLLQ